jgi:Transposase zinc-binding domain
MSAVECCRTATLGSHIAQWENGVCRHIHIAYNSCRNRHCPMWHGAAVPNWLADPEAESLPVGYFHVVFTLPLQIGSIAYQNKRVIYDLIMKAFAEMTITIAAASSILVPRSASHRSCIREVRRSRITRICT